MIILEVEASDKKKLFEMAVDLAVDKGYVFDREAFLQSLWHREQDSPIPHSRSGAATDEVVVIYLSLKRPIPGYTCDDGEPVKVILMISAGENIQGYLKILKLIGQAMGQESVRQQLYKVETEAKVMAIFDLI